MIKSKPGFLSDDEKEKYFAKLGDCDLGVYKYYSTVKAYVGAEILLYHYDAVGHVIWDGVLMCTGILVTEEGLKITLVDRVSYIITKAVDVPTAVYPYDIMTHAPHRCFLDRTVKTTQRGTRLLGLATSLSFRSLSDPREQVPDHVQAVPLGKAKRFFGEKEYDLSIARMEAQQNVL